MPNTSPPPNNTASFHTNTTSSSLTPENYSTTTARNGTDKLQLLDSETEDSLLGKFKAHDQRNLTWTPPPGPPLEPQCDTAPSPDTSPPPPRRTCAGADMPIAMKTPNPDLNPGPQHTQSHVRSTIRDTSPRPTWPTDLMERITAITALPSPPLNQPPFSFQLTREASHKNFCILRKFGTLEATIRAHPNTPLDYGSEFRPPGQLEQILQSHPNWSEFRRLIENGSDWPLAEISEAERKMDVEEALAFGNHKGAETNYTLLRELITDDVIHGYSLPLPLDKIHLLPNILIAPMNIVEQDTIDEQGATIPKFRLTHDQSFKFENGSNTSLNSRLDKGKLHPCYFGWVIRRLVNWTVAARRKHPNSRIFATKVDFKSAYRRLHLHHRIAAQSCTILPNDKIALMALRLMFGGAACPFEWSVISETVCDLATAIAHDENWDPKELQAPDQELIPPPVFLPDDIPLAPGKDLIVDVDVDNRGTHEMYLDDLIGVGIDIPNTDNRARAERAPLLAIHTCARPLLSEEPITRETMAAKRKLKAEAGLTEVKIILGWKWDFRRLIISLPYNKYTSWSESILHMIVTSTVTTSLLETAIGRLGHLALVVPPVLHFLSRLRELHTRASRANRRTTRIPPGCIADLKLMSKFLDKAHEGVNMNTIAFRRPTHVYRSDSCPAGLGGYSHTGFAWRYYLPDTLLFRASNNLLEHIAAIITPWVDILAGRLQRGDCALSMTDSTTSEGWLRKTNFLEDAASVQASVRIQVAREHAWRYMNLEIRDYSQWFPGIENNVADALSREMDFSDDELTKLLHLSFPNQIPESFVIVPLPSEIVLWLTLLLQQMPVNEQFKEEHTRTTLGLGNAGTNIASQQDSNMTPTSPHSPANRGSKSSEPSQPPSETLDLQEILQLPWLSRQSRAPSVTWSRPFGVSDTQTPLVTPTDY
jgi:hypothetical protein